MVLRGVSNRLLFLAIAVLICLMLASPPGSSSQAAATGVQPGVAGDVNCSGSPDAVDSLQILLHTAGLPADAGCLEQSGDVGCDALIDTTDSIDILRYANSLPLNARAGCPAIGADLPGGAQGLARKLAQDVLGADGDEARYQALLAVMEPLEIGVYAADEGQPIVLGQERAAGDFYLYDFELQTMATHIAGGDTSPVDDLATLLSDVGFRENLQPITPAGMRTRLLNGVAGAFQDPENPMSLLPMIVRELGVRQSASYDLLEDVALEDLKLNPLQFFLAYADVTLPTVFDGGPVAITASHLLADSDGLLKPAANIAGTIENCLNWGKDGKHIWPVGVLAVGLTVIGTAAVLSAAAIDAVHGMILAYGVKVISPDDFLITHYGHASPGNELRFRVNVFMQDHLDERQIKCGWLLGVEWPKHGGIEGVEVRWKYPGLPRHGDVDCNPRTCEQTDENGLATLVFQPKQEQEPYGQGPQQTHQDVVVGTAYYLSKFGNVLGRVNEKITPKESEIRWEVDWHENCPGGGGPSAAGVAGADPPEGTCAFEGEASATHNEPNIPGGALTYTITASNLRFEWTRDQDHPGGATYELTEGTVTVEVTGYVGDCTFSGGFAIQEPMDDGTHVFGGGIALDLENNKYAVSGGVVDQESHVIFQCPDGPSFMTPAGSHLWVLSTTVLPLIPDRPFTPGDDLIGSYDTTGPLQNWSSHYEWSFHPAACDPSPVPACSAAATTAAPPSRQLLDN